MPRLAPPSVRPLLRPTPTRPSIQHPSCALPPSVPAPAHTPRPRVTKSAQESASERPSASFALRVLSAPSPLVPLWCPPPPHLARHIVSSHVRQDAIVVDLAVDLALADELVSLSG